MPTYRSVNPYLFVKDADGISASYAAVLGATQTDREPKEGKGVQRLVVQIGDAVVVMTELLPPGHYCLLNTENILQVEVNVRATEGWAVTQEIAVRGDSFVLHATDPAGITWIVQQAVTLPTYRTANPYVATSDAAEAIASYVAVLGGTEIDRELAGDGPGIARAVVKVGDASIALTDQVPPTHYILLNTADIAGIARRISSTAGWAITQQPSPRGDFSVMHATDPFGVTWIIQEPVAASTYRAVNAYLLTKDADALVASYSKVLGAKLIDREPCEGPGVQRAVVQIGDAVLVMTELLPPANYILLNTAGIDAVERNIQAAAGSGWAITQPKATKGTFQVLHATDPAGVTWIVQQPLTTQ